MRDSGEMKCTFYHRCGQRNTIYIKQSGIGAGFVVPRRSD